MISAILKHHSYNHSLPENRHEAIGVDSNRGEEIRERQSIAFPGSGGLAIVAVKDGRIPQDALKVPHHLEVISADDFVWQKALPLPCLAPVRRQKLEKRCEFEF